jgi:hypothetical protein
VPGPSQRLDEWNLDLVQEVIVFAEEQGVFLLCEHKHDVSWDSAWQLVGLPTHDYLLSVLHSLFNHAFQHLAFLLHFAIITLTATLWAVCLHLLDHARPDLASNHLDTVPIAPSADPDWCVHRASTNCVLARTCIRVNVDACASTNMHTRAHIHARIYAPKRTNTYAHL